MPDLELKIAFGEYDRTMVLADGTVKLKGIDATYASNKIVTEIFAGMIRDRAYDVCEVGLSYFLRTMDYDDPPFVALPVFPNRVFRHSAIYINKHSEIKKPEDLKGKRVGEFAMYGHDAGVWPKGILSDEYGVKPEDCEWTVGKLDWPLKPVGWIPQPHPQNCKIMQKTDCDLGAMLEKGEIDALISADVPKCILDKSPNVTRLFEDYETVERDYYKRTGIFPIMHLIVVTKELAKEHPELLRSIYEGFCEAKNHVEQNLKFGEIFNNMPMMEPWFTALVERNKELMGEDWWPYGMEKNRKAVDAFLRYHFEQGLSRNRLTCEDIFVEGLMDT
jgi:hypothetical protein